MAKDPALNKDYYKWYVANDFSHFIPNSPGCYAIYKINIETKQEVLMYIGTAQNLYIRLKKHAVLLVLRALLSLPELVKIKCKVIENPTIRFTTEDRLIKRLRPPVNYA
jgi:excinuclease UvrABC nuclease subunit